MSATACPSPVCQQHATITMPQPEAQRFLATLHPCTLHPYILHPYTLHPYALHPYTL